MPGLTASIAESVSLAVQQALMARCEAMQHMCSDGTGSGQLYPKPCAGPALTATTRAVYQDMEAFPHYCTSALWRIMQTSTPPAQRFGAFVTHALQLGDATSDREGPEDDSGDVPVSLRDGSARRVYVSHGQKPAGENG